MLADRRSEAIRTAQLAGGAIALAAAAGADGGSAVETARSAGWFGAVVAVLGLATVAWG